MQQTVSSYRDIFLAKQPVFGTEGGLWGFQLLYRGHSPTLDLTEDNDLASVAVTVAAGLHPADDRSSHPHIALSFSSKSILAGVPEALPPDNLVVEINESQAGDPEMRDALNHIAEKGYRLALNDFQARPDAAWVVPLSEYLCIDMRGAPPQDIAGIAAAGRSAGKQLVAKHVNDLKTRQLAATIGCTLFQGYFFKQPEIVFQRTLSSHEAGRLRLLKLIQRESLVLEELVDAIRSDVGLSYRLVNYLNSPFFGMRHTIHSVEQAVTLLGWQQLVDWLRVIILADFTNGDASRELAFASVQRARFLELTGRYMNASDGLGHTRFLLGLFSLLDVMLAMPMDELIAPLNLEPAVTAALQGKTNGESHWLGLAIAFEKGDWKKLDTTVEAMGLDPATVARCYAESLDWTSSLLMEHPPTPH